MRETIIALIAAIIISLAGLFIIILPFIYKTFYWVILVGGILLAVGNALAAQYAQRLKKELKRAKLSEKDLFIETLLDNSSITYEEAEDKWYRSKGRIPIRSTDDMIKNPDGSLSFPYGDIIIMGVVNFGNNTVNLPTKKFYPE